MRIAMVVLALIALAGCGAVARSSGAMPVGPDTYRISARASLGDPIESQKMALTEASMHCATMHKQMVVTATNRSNSLERGPFEVTFRCLNEGDPDLVRPNLQRAPDTVIQMR